MRLTVRAFLDSHGLSAYRVAEYGRGRVSRNMVYAVARGEADRIALKSLGGLAAILTELTGKPVRLEDLLALDYT